MHHFIGFQDGLSETLHTLAYIHFLEITCTSGWRPGSGMIVVMKF